MSRAMMRWGAVICATLLVGGGPILVASYILENHALAQGRAEARAIAQDYLDKAEGLVGEALGALQRLRSRHVTGCTSADRTAYGMEAFASGSILQIGVADAAGSVICAEPMGPLAQPFRLPAAERGDPSIMIGILTGARDARQGFVTLKSEGDRRLVARIRQESLAIESGAAFLKDQMSVGVFLEDGAQWISVGDAWAREMPTDTIVETVTSARYPVRTIVTAAADAARKPTESLTIIIVVGSIVGGFVVFVGGLFLISGNDQSGDIFTRAVQNREFVPFYQPAFDIFTGELKGCEVLVRWRRPDGSMVPPGQFLPYAEATGLIRDITRSLMQQTVADCAELYAAHPSLKLSINLTAQHFVDLEVVDDIRAIYAESGIAYEQLCFEVTEQHPLKDLTLSRTIIGRIQGLGAAVALDDVGTGHGGLAYLQKLGMDIIKIDKMFVDNIATDHSSQTIVETLVELGNQLGLGIIAEGVETQEQVEHLKRMGVSTAQGYLFAKPLPAAAYLELAWQLMGQAEGARGLQAIAADAPPADSPAPSGDSEEATGSGRQDAA